MFTLYSKGCEYVLRALVCAEKESVKGTFLIKKVCRRAKVPEPYTRKMFQKLASEGFLKVVRGPGGGYQFKRATNKISLLDIIRAVDGKNSLEHCVMGLPQCGTSSPCLIHETWAKMKDKILKELTSEKLDRLTRIPYLKQ